MEAVYKAIKDNGISFTLGQENEFAQLYKPFHPRPDGTVTVVHDVAYGPDARNTLDVYFPSNSSHRPCLLPVVIYAHGGGFFSGDKAWTDEFYANIGHYFAQKDFIVVIGNHHLVPDAVYPQGSEDIQLTRDWVYNNIESVQYGGGDVNKVILFGHSSGGAHIASNLYSAGDPNLPQRDPLFPPVAGVTYLSSPWWFDRQKPVRAKTIKAYYGSDSELVWEPISPIGLFNRIPDDSPLLDSDRVPTYLGTVKWETKEATDGALMFFNSYRERSKPAGTLPLYHVLDKHNHISNILSIGTEDDEQGAELLRFFKSCVCSR